MLWRRKEWSGGDESANMRGSGGGSGSERDG